MIQKKKNPPHPWPKRPGAATFPAGRCRSEAHRPFALPARRSLPETLAHEIERGIRSGEFNHFLPSTRVLSSLFDVSLPTVGLALRLLKDQKVIDVSQGLPTRILHPRSPSNAGKQAVSLLLAESMPSGMCWPQREIIGQIQTALLSKGITPILSPSKLRGFQSDRKWLETVTESARVRLWLLLSPTLAVQRFFDQKKIPAIVLGNIGPGIGLSGIGINQQAVANHAAATLWRLGHRRILCVRDNTDRMGDEISLEYFSKRLHTLSAGQAAIAVIRCPHERDSTARALEKALRLHAGTTACFFTHASTALIALTYLSRTGRKVPETLSLLCAQHADFLLQVHPSIASYRLNLRTFGSRLLRRIEQTLSGSPAKPETSDLLMPEFINGESLASAHGQPATDKTT